MSYQVNYTGYQSTTNGDSSIEYQRLTSAINSNIQKISHNVYVMQRMVNQIGTSSDCDSLRSQLRDAQQETNVLVKTTSDNIKELTNIPNPVNPSELKHRKVGKDRLTQNFYDVLKNFQVIQRTSVDKQRDSVSRARANSGLKPLDPPPGKNLIDFQSPSPTTKQPPAQQTVQLQLEEECNLEELRTREAEIRKLEEEIKGVNSIFNELAGIVHIQGEVIDSIEANVEVANIHVSDGVSELAKASEYQRRSRYKMFWLALILSIIVLVILVIVLKS